MISYKDARQKTNDAIERRQKVAADSVQPFLIAMNDLIIKTIDNCQFAASINIDEWFRPDVNKLQKDAITNYYDSLGYNVSFIRGVVNVDWYPKNDSNIR